MKIAQSVEPIRRENEYSETRPVFKGVATKNHLVEMVLPEFYWTTSMRATARAGDVARMHRPRGARDERRRATPDLGTARVGFVAHDGLRGGGSILGSIGRED
jgi:hypothetical protein